MTFGEHARPFLTLHVGQAGTQIGHAIWELLCLEHNIQPNGSAKPECDSNGFYDAMFIRSSSGHYMPRTIFVDTDPTCINEVRVGPYRDMFSSNQLVSDHFDAGCNYVRGRRDFNNRLVPDAVDRFRWLIEKTDTSPTAFLVHGISGGTGSGVAVSCLESLADEFGSSLRVLELNVTSGRSGLQNSCELVNQVLYQYESRDFTNLSFAFTNSAMFNVCRSGLNLTNATYAHVNRILAMCFSNLTAMERFPGTVSCSVDSIASNVLPFKHMKHPILACAPFTAADSLSKERISPLGVASAVVEQDSQLADIDLRQGKHMAGVLIFRGAAKPSDIDQALASLRPKSRMEFVEWAPAGFKTGLIELPPLAVASSGIGNTLLSVTMISNHTAVASLFRGQSESIRKLSTGSYFLHNYEALASGGLTSGHNSDIRNLLKESCDYMDSVATVYESEKPPELGDDSFATSAHGQAKPPSKNESRPPPPPLHRRSPPKTGSHSPPNTGSHSPPKTGLQSPPRTVLQSPPKTGLQSPPKTGLQSPPKTGLQSPPKTGLQTPLKPEPQSPPKPGSEPSPVSDGSQQQLEVSESVRSQGWKPPAYLAADGTQQQCPGTTEDQPSEGVSGSVEISLGQQLQTDPAIEKDKLVGNSMPPHQGPDPQVPITAEDSSRITLGQGGQAPTSRSTPMTSEAPTPGATPKREVAAGSSKKSQSSGCCKRRQQPARAAPPAGAGRPGAGPVRPGAGPVRPGAGPIRPGAGPVRPVAAGGMARAQSQNHAMPSSRLDTESWRSSNSSEPATIEHLGGHWTSGHNARRAVSCHHREESTASTRSADSSADLNDLIQSCLPDSALVGTTISSVRQIIDKYNQLFTNEFGPGSAAGRQPK